MIEVLLSTLIAHWPFVVIVATLSWFLRNKFFRGIEKYPGPFLAGFTDWWRVLNAAGGAPEKTQRALHKEHGDVVRLGPNLLSFAAPEAIKDIYGLDKPFAKSDYYSVPMAHKDGVRIPSLFSTQDESYHSKLKRCVNHAFSMSTLVNFEPLVNSTLLTFFDEIDTRFAETGAVCELQRWLLYFASDVIGEMAWSKQLGFVKSAGDVSGILTFNEDFLQYAMVTGQNPPLDYLLADKNPIKMFLARKGLWPSKGNPVATFAAERAKERADEKVSATDLEKATTDSTSSGSPKAVDFLTRFRLAQRDHPEFFTDAQVLAVSVSLLFAGSDSTAISLTATLFFLMRNPRVYAKVMTELDDAISTGAITPTKDGLIAWKEANADAGHLPYLNACITETFRIHSAAGVILERVIPTGGAIIAGHAVPGGTIVGCNSWVLHYNKDVFGADADVYRPERWLEADESRLKAMHGSMFHFGAGRRTCIGKNISLLEVYKFIPSFLLRFELEFAHPPPETMKTRNRFFVGFEEFDVKIKPRSKETKSG